MGNPQSGFLVANVSDDEVVLGFAEPGETHVGDSHAGWGLVIIEFSIRRQVTSALQVLRYEVIVLLQAQAKNFAMLRAGYTFQSTAQATWLN